jgi:hypothetical protein
VPLRSVLPTAVAIVGLVIAALPVPALAAAPGSDIPAWLKAHVGTGDGQIAPVVLQRARALYLQKVSKGAVKNPCYFAMDATRPHELGNGKAGHRFYIICESKHSFRAVSSGHGGGRHVKGLPDFANGKQCARNFGNAMDSKLTAGGAYVTAEAKTSFKGYYRVSAKHDAALVRTFVQFDGQGETANARAREIGGHPAVLVREYCRFKKPHSPYADHDGYVPFGRFENYADGRSNGCTSWSWSDARDITAMVKDNPTTLYIYPDAADIEAVAQAVKAGRPPARAGLYWNATCLREIHAPKFWPDKTLGPLIAQYKKAHPPGPERPLPICKGR